MFLRELDGFYKGQIREFAPEVGRALVAAGRAVDPYAVPEPTVPAPVAKVDLHYGKKAGRR